MLFRSVQQGKIPEEIPYGYSWFLTLARERELSTGQTDLLPLATEIRDQLRALEQTLQEQHAVSAQFAVESSDIISAETLGLSKSMLELCDLPLGD